MGGLIKHVARSVADRYLGSLPEGPEAFLPIAVDSWSDLAQAARRGGIPLRVASRAMTAARVEAGKHEMLIETLRPPEKGVAGRRWSTSYGALTAVRTSGGEALTLKAHGLSARKREARLSVAFLQTEVWDHAIDRAVERTGSQPRVLLRDGARVLSMAGIVGMASPSRECSEFALPLRGGLLLGELVVGCEREDADPCYTVRVSRNAVAPHMFGVLNMESGRPFRVIIKTYVHSKMLLPEQEELAERLRKALQARTPPPDPCTLAHWYCESVYDEEHWQQGSASLGKNLWALAGNAASVMEEYRRPDGTWKWRLDQ